MIENLSLDRVTMHEISQQNSTHEKIIFQIKR